MFRAPQIFGVILSLCLFFLLPTPVLSPLLANEPTRVSLTPEELTFLEKHPQIVLATEKEWEPSVIVRKNGSIVGYDVDILDLVNKHTGANFTLQAGNWQVMLKKAKNREIDGLSGGAVHARRREYLNFSDVYNHLLRMVLVLKGNPLNIQKWDDLTDKKIVIQKGNLFDEKIIKKLPKSIIVRTDTVDELLRALISGRADAAFGQGSYMYRASKLGISTLQYAFVMEDKLDLVFSIRNDWPEALSIMNKGLRAIPQDKYDRIYSKWYGALPEDHFNYVLFLKIALPLALAAATLLAFYFRKMNQRLLFVQTELKKDIAHRERAQEKLDWEYRVNKALAELANTLISLDQRIIEIASKVLATAQSLTQSEHGFVSEIDRITHDNIVHTLTGMLGDSCQVSEPYQKVVFPRGKDGLYPKLWGHALNTGEAFFTNSPGSHPKSEGIPKGHIVLDRFLSVPVKYGDEVIGQIGLANPPFNYSDRHIGAVQQIADLYALAVQRERSQQDSLLIEAQLRQAQKMESLGTLAGGIAHDFNNILSAIIGYSELAFDDGQEGVANLDSIKEIQKAGERAKDLVTQILTFSRKMEPDFKPIDLNQAVKQIKKMLERTFPKMVSIEDRLADDLWPINADDGNIIQLLMNLCTNAHDAMPDGGQLVIETENVTLDLEYANQHAEAEPGDYVRLTVADTGCGMDKETIEHIFDPFFTSKEIGKGTGLGLSTVYGIVKSHDGHIMCYSELDQGTTFRVYLPALVSDSVSEKRREAEQDNIQGRGETILLVDDEEQIRDICGKLLTRWGYQVIVANCGEDALNIYRERYGEIDLVILDISMPGMGGHKCLKELLLLNRELKVVVSSGYSLTGRLKNMQIDGAAGFVPKPFSRMEMLKEVREVLDR